MKLHQLSLFLENRPGKIKIPSIVLAEAKINMLALTLADTQEYGILRLIVKDWRRGKEVLESAGFIVTVTEVVAVDVLNEPGGLVRVLEVLDEAKQGIDYMYAFCAGSGEKTAALVFRFQNADAAIAALAQAGINAVAPAELFARLDA